MQVFFDLDGTLIDVEPRHYRIYCNACKHLGGNPLPKVVYWAMKRSKVSWDVILAKSGIDTGRKDDLLNYFISHIENVDELMEDKIFDGAIATLEKLSKNNECYLVSLRRNEDNLLLQIDRLGLAHVFVKILTGHSEGDGSDVKQHLIKKMIPPNANTAFIVGDTEADVLAAKALGLRSVAVTTGIRSKEFLVEIKPDYIIERISDLTTVIK